MEEVWGMSTNIITPIQLQAGLCIIQHLCFTDMLHSIIYMTEIINVFCKCIYWQKHCTPTSSQKPEYSHLEVKYYSWIVSLSSITPSSADKSIRLA